LQEFHEKVLRAYKKPSLKKIIKMYFV